MRVGFGELSELRLIIDVGALDSETTRAASRIRLNIGDAFNFVQIASDRGGTTASRHVRHFEGH